MTSYLGCDNISKIFTDADQTVQVLSDININIKCGETLAFMGPSGSGKSTLLHILGGLDQPSSGIVSLLGNDIHRLSEKNRCRLRNEQLGFVYQFHHLLPEFSALENVAMPLRIQGLSKSEAIKHAKPLLTEVGLADRAYHKPGQLSGGERQRTAIARALVTKPKFLLADEPTGNLDAVTAGQIDDLLLSFNNKYGTSLIIVTHDTRLADKMKKQYTLSNGRLYEQAT